MNAVTAICLRHRRLVVLAWLVLAVAGAAMASSTTGRLTHSFATPGTAGYDANLHLLQTFGIDGNEQPTIGVLKLPPGQSMKTAAGQRIAARTFAAANRAGHLAVADYANTRNPRLISADGLTTWALFDMPNPDVPPGTGVMEGIGPALRAAAPPGVTVSVTGFEQIQAVGSSTGGVAPSVLAEALIAGVAALAVLLFVYGSAVAIVPLLIAVPSILTTFLLVSGLTKVTDVSFLVQYLVAVLGLGIAVDYSLLLITRWREEREAGRSNEEAILAASPTAGRAVVLSGITVAVGLLSLVLLPVPFLRSIGLGGMLIPLVAIASAVTLLLLARTFRAAVLAAKAVLVNVVSLGASFGFLVLFWQHGFGSNLIYGVPATGSIRNWVPIVSFAFLFGISMDYEVFILARMREEYDRTRSTREAVVGALARTGRLVTCAAVILAISFASLSSAPDVVVEMIATGLGVGILVDAVVVRTLLVPALVAIMGRWNWWLPGGLARLLRVPPTTTSGHLAGAKHPVGR